MARHGRFPFILPDGRTIRGNFLIRGRYLKTRFPHPGQPGKYVETATGIETPKGFTVKKEPPADWFTESARIIADAYRPALASKPTEPDPATWDAVLAHIRTTPDLRPDSIRAYVAAIQAIRKILPAQSPAEITVQDADRFKREFQQGTYARGHANDATRFTRSPTSCRTYLRCLRSIWKKHLKPAGFVNSNPWLEIAYPNTPKGKRVRLPDEDAVTALFEWFATRFPSWELPALFVKVKMLAVCRTLDLCKAKSADLTGNVLTLSAEASKTRTARNMELPPDLASRLHAMKGATWLWERSVAESKVHRAANTTKAREDYQPTTWKHTIENLFREFNAGRDPKARVRPHDLRARGMTMLAIGTGSVDAVAEAVGCDVQTARHYLDASKAFNGMEILKRMAPILRGFNRPGDLCQDVVTIPSSTPVRSVTHEHPETR